MTEKAYIEKKMCFQVILGDSSDQQGFESICFLNDKGRFETYWDVMTNILDEGGWDENESCFLMEYGKITLNYSNQKKQICEKVYEGEFYMNDSELCFIKGREKNTHTFFSSLVGCHVNAHFQFAKNEEIFKIHLEKNEIQSKLQNSHKKSEEIKTNKGFKI